MNRAIWQKKENETKGCKVNNKNSVVTLVFILILGIGIALGSPIYTTNLESFLWVFAGTFIVACFVSSAIKIANQWDRAIILRLGSFRAMKGPGIFFIIPIFDKITHWIDIRVITTAFKAEKTLTKDTVPVDVDAVLFWKVIDPKKAALEIADYESAIGWASQTALRDVIGITMLSDMLEGRNKISKELQKIIDDRTEPWGVNVISVEIKDVKIPPDLENAMSMQAQAERERQARVILGDSERQIAEKFGEASKTYINNPTALHLRAMNMLYEGLKKNSTIVLVPSSAIESMQLGGLAGMTAMTLGLQREHANNRKEVRPERKEEDTDTDQG